MRILHVLNHTAMFNGMAHAAVDLACEQSALGHHVAICSGGGDFDQLLTKHGVQIIPIQQPRPSLSVLRTTAQLYRALRAFRPDVVEAHMVQSAVIARLLTWMLNIPLVTCVQNSFSRYAPVMRIGERVITGSDAVARDMAKRGIPERKLRPLLNGTIGSARRPAMSSAPMVLNHPAVITMCGLHHRKGVGFLIKGFEAARATMPLLHLYILGEGPNEQEYRDLVSPEHREHVHFLGAMADPRPYLLGADVFVLASLADPAPLAIIEAREAGLAMIGTDVDGIPELLDFGEAGILIPSKSSEAITEALTTILADDDSLHHWKQKSQFHISRLTVRRVAEETVKIYAETMPSRREVVLSAS